MRRFRNFHERPIGHPERIADVMMAASLAVASARMPGGRENAATVNGIESGVLTRAG
jgi:hypothetical protein